MREKLSLVVIVAIAIALPITLILVRYQQNLFGRAAEPDKLEAEGGVLSSTGVSKQTDSQASGGQYVLFANANQTPPPTPAFTPFTFTAGGDYGYPEATNTLKQMAQGSEFTIALGDLSYGNITPESAWCNYVKTNVGTNYPFQLIAGNHDDGGVASEGFIDNFAICLPNKMSINGTYGRQYYFDYPSANPYVRFILIDPAIDYVSGTPSYLQGNANYNWTQNAIDSARSSGIKWVVVAMHKNCITAGVKNCEIGENLMDLLISKKVDLVLQGHDHNYQRSKQIGLSANCPNVNQGSFNSSCVEDDGSDGLYPKGNGTIFVISGNAGKCCYTVSNSDPDFPYFAKYQGVKGGPVFTGFSKYEVSENRIKMDYIPTNGTFTDTFTIQ